MGTDIDGAIEVRGADGVWAVGIDLLDYDLGRDRDAWDCYFGFGRRGGIDRPLFPYRGLPADASTGVRRTALDDYQHGHTYATWAEVAAVDWDAPLGEKPAWDWVGEWRPGPDGEPVLRGVVPTTMEMVEQATDRFGENLLLAPEEWPPDAGVEVDGAVYRPVVLTAGLLAPLDRERWAPMWEAMRALAAEHGAGNVRLVVWFG